MNASGDPLLAESIASREVVLGRLGAPGSRALQPPRVLSLASCWPELLQVPLARIRLRARPSRPQRPGRRPSYLGPLLYGALGRALRELACGQAAPTCSRSGPCAAPGACAYRTIFEPPPRGPAPGGPGSQTPPPRHVLRWQYGPEPWRVFASGRFEPGRELALEVILLGPAAAHSATLAQALLRMLERGLGPNRVPLLPLADGAGQPLRQEAARPFGAWLREQPALPPRRVLVRLRTPLRLGLPGRRRHGLSWRALVRAAVRRLRLVAEQPPPVSARRWAQQLVQRAGSVRLVHARLRWCEWTHRSARQRTAIRLGGMHGEALFEGDLAPFDELLRLIELVHLGKAVGFGLGRLEVARCPLGRTPPAHPSARVRVAHPQASSAASPCSTSSAGADHERVRS